MADRTQFTFYGSFFEAAKRIKNKQARCDLYDIICRYALEGTEPDLDKVPDSVAVAFITAKPNLDASRKKAQNGKQGGSKRKQTESKPEANESKTENCESEKENEMEKENEIEIEGEKEKKQTPPIDGSLFTRFWEAFPNKLGREKAWEAWKKLNPDKAMAELLVSALELWKRSDRWRNKLGSFQFAPRAEAFLSDDGYWKHPPEVIGGAGGQRQPDEDELEAIRRMMHEPNE